MERIGFIGLGIMGKPMARNLIKAGYSLVLYNRSQEPVHELVAAGGTAASSAKEVAEKSGVVITMLPDSPDVEQVVLGPAGVIEGLQSGMLYIDMSSIAPATSKAICDALRQKR